MLLIPVWQATAVEGTIQQLFEGHHMNYIECINVDYKSTRKESFYGMQISLDKVL
jgi:ubiquitin carboxyl-terminal hydrolase 7